MKLDMDMVIDVNHSGSPATLLTERNRLGRRRCLQSAGKTRAR
ncbi:hypothetical protein WME91_47305 [Sorangium sp. So ce269]